MDLAQFKKNGKFLMLAFDHRGSFKRLMNPQNPDSVTEEMAIALKRLVIESVYDVMSSILVDEDSGLPALKQVLDGKVAKPFLMPLEKSGYEQKGKERLTTLVKTASQLKELGAYGAKLLLFFNPNAKSALDQIETAKRAIEDCRKSQMPLFLEPRTYDDEGKEADEMESQARGKIATDTLKMLIEHKIYPDVYKLEYPGSALGCQTYSAILQDFNIPWIMLTMGASFEEFTKQLEVAVLRGCVGFLAGRAVWQEVCSMQVYEKQKFLTETLPERFRIISDIAQSK